MTLRGRLTVSVAEAAGLLGIGRGLAYELARLGEIPTLRLGHRLVVPLPALLEMVGVKPESDPEAIEAALDESSQVTNQGI